MDEASAEGDECREDEGGEGGEVWKIARTLWKVQAKKSICIDKPYGKNIGHRTFSTAEPQSTGLQMRQEKAG